MAQPTDRSLAGRPRARDFGLVPGGRPGVLNAITDVPGVEVGYRTLVEGDAVRTGVTAIHPRGRSAPGDPCIGGFHSQNGQGEMTGVWWLLESGTFSGPIVLTNSHAIGPAHQGVIDWYVKHHPRLAEGWLLPVVAETWDGYLNDINGGHVTPAIVVQALEDAASGPVSEGSVGGGTGMNCYGYKGGTGTASRLVSFGDDTFTVGVLVQANFGAREDLTVAGVRVGEHLLDDNPIADHFARPGAGSIIAVVGTDAPLLPQQCAALARRVTLGIGRTGTCGDHFSGDLFVVFSTAHAGAITTEQDTHEGRAEERLDHVTFVPWGFQDRFNQAVVQATEEAILNALVVNDEMVGIHGRRSPALPVDRVVELVRSAPDRNL